MIPPNSTKKKTAATIICVACFVRYFWRNIRFLILSNLLQQSGKRIMELFVYIVQDRTNCKYLRLRFLFCPFYVKKVEKRINRLYGHPDKSTAWPHAMTAIQLAINSCTDATTGYTPFKLLPRLVFPHTASMIPPMPLDSPVAVYSSGKMKGKHLPQSIYELGRF